MPKSKIPLFISDISGMAQSIIKQHKTSGNELSQSLLLNYIAKSQGFQNYQSLKAQADSVVELKDDFQSSDLEFTRERMSIINMGLQSDTFSDSYLYAWQKAVYPVDDDTDIDMPNKPHEHFKNNFLIPPDSVLKVLDFLDEIWLNNQPYTFYELEREFGGKWGNEFGRVNLLQICRYSYLKGHFDDEFWKHLVKPMTSPSEARSIIRKFNKEQEIYI